MEKGSDIFKILQKDGLEGIWEYIQEQFTDLKESVIGEIKNMVITQVITAGIKWVIGLLNPASAFVKAAMTIYDIVMFFVNRGSQIIELVKAVTESIKAIASGSVGAVAKAIEGALAKSVPVLIGFLASLLGIGGLVGKVQNIIKKIRKRIDKAIDKLLLKAKKAAKKLLRKTGLSKKGKFIKKDKDAGLAAFEKEERPFLENNKITNKNAKKVAQNVKNKHPVFKSITVIDGQNSWDYNYIFRAKKQTKSKKAEIGTIDYKGLNKEGKFKNNIDKLIEEALERITPKFYVGQQPADAQDETDAPEGIEKIIRNIQRKYRSAVTGKNNIIEVGGKQFFVDQARNNYVYPLTRAQKAGIITNTNGQITTEERVDGFEYTNTNSDFQKLTVGRLLYFLRNINYASEDSTTMLIASLAAEPFRYPPSHITNLLVLNNPDNKEEEAFDIMAMTTGGTDPTSKKNKRKDTRKPPKGTVPNKVRKRQINIIRNETLLYKRLTEWYERKSHLNEKTIVKKFGNIISNYMSRDPNYQS